MTLFKRKPDLNNGTQYLIKKLPPTVSVRTRAEARLLKRILKNSRGKHQVDITKVTVSEGYAESEKIT